MKNLRRRPNEVSKDSYISRKPHNGGMKEIQNDTKGKKITVSEVRDRKFFMLKICFAT